MKNRTRTVVATAILVTASGPAFAHHVMDGQTPVTFVEGLLSGLGHPVIGLDHLAAVIAVGLLASMHRGGALLVIGFVLAMIGGAALHLRGATIPVAEALVALSVLLLGLTLLRHRHLAVPAALTLFVLAGLVHGYALGESIVGAEPSPLAAYFVGLAVIQSAIALAAMAAARAFTRKNADMTPLRLSGAAIAGIGFAILVQQITAA